MSTNGAGWWEVADPETVHRVCRLIRDECKGCPASEVVGDGPETSTRGCYLRAVECVNVVETGNPWRKTEDVKAPWTVLDAGRAALEQGS